MAVISGNGLSGVFLVALANDNFIQGNLIGTDINGTTALPNTDVGVSIFGWVHKWFLSGSAWAMAASPPRMIADSDIPTAAVRVTRFSVFLFLIVFLFGFRLVVLVLPRVL